MSWRARLCLGAFLLLLVLDGARSWYEGIHRRGRHRQIFSYPRDWDIDWVKTQAEAQRRRGGRHRSWGSDWESGDPVPVYDYQAAAPAAHTAPTALPLLRPRAIVLPSEKVDTRGVWQVHQRGSSLIPHKGATVRVTPYKGSNNKFYRGVVTSTVSDGPPRRRRGHRNQRQKNRSHTRQHHRQQEWRNRQHQQQQDEPPRSKVCARCPSDRAVLAKKGAVSVLMDTPPIIPCHPWSSVEKVKQEIVAGPQPGSEVLEGSHKIVIRLYHHRRTLSTCVTRYNVIVRKCPELEVGPGVQTDCPLGKAWGAHCNVTCDPGYELEGDADTECTDDLEWSGVMPQCIATTSCSVPVSPDNGHISCRTPQHQPVRPRGAGMLPDGSVCHYRCDAGYTVPPAQAHLTRVRCVGGAWDSDQDPTCIETNALEVEPPETPEITAEDALRFDSEDCPQHFCKNGGMCIMILNEPMCSCLSGYSGSNCEDLDIDPDPDESNTIT